MVRPEVVDIHGIHETEGPLLTGGVGYLAPHTGLFTGMLVLQHLRSEKAFRDYLEFREESFRKAAAELVSAFNSPVDLFFLTDLDVDLFQRLYYNHRAFTQLYNMIVDDEFNRSGAHNTSTNFLLNEDRISFKMWNSDPKEVLKKIKPSARWFELSDFDRERGLKSHMDLLKEYRSKFGSTFGSSSVPEYENVALARINSEMGSELEKHMYMPDQWLMNEYFQLMKVRNFATQFSTLAENNGTILVKEFLPARVQVKEHMVLPSIKHAVEHSVKGWMVYLRGAAARVKNRWSALGFGILGAATFGMNESELRRTN